MASYRALAHAWGPKPKYSLWMWTSVLRPRITYGAFVWANAAAKRTNQAKFRCVQRLAPTLAAPLRRSTPGRALKIMFNIAPLHLHIKVLALATCVRIGANMIWVTMRRTKGHIEHTLKELPESLTTAVLDKALTKGTGT